MRIYKARHRDEKLCKSGPLNVICRLSYRLNYDIMLYHCALKTRLGHFKIIKSNQNYLVVYTFHE